MADFLSFKNLRLFKSPAAGPSKNGASPAGARPSQPWSFKRVVTDPILLTFVFVLVLAYLISYVPSRSLPLPPAGSIASSDIVAPADLTIPDVEATQQRRADARATVLPVYAFNPNVLANTEVKVRQSFAAAREWIARTSGPAGKLEALQKLFVDDYDLKPSVNDLSWLVRLGFPPALEDDLFRLLSAALSRGVIVSRSLLIHGEQARGLTLVRGAEEHSVKASDILDMKEARDLILTTARGLELPGRTKAVLIDLAGMCLSPNVTFDQAETSRRLDRAAASVEPVFYMIKKGKVLVRKGDEVTPDVLRQVRIINQNLRATPSWFLNFAGTFLFFGLILLIAWYYLRSLLGQKPALTLYGLLGLILTLSLALDKLGLFLSQVLSQTSTWSLLTHPESNPYGFPFQFGALLFAFLTSPPISLIYVIINSLVVGYLFRADFFLMIFSLIGGLAAIYGVKLFGRQRRTSVLRTGIFLIAPFNVFMVIALQLVREPIGSLGPFFSAIFLAVVGAVLSAALGFVLLPLVENVFGFVTQPRLLDLTNSEQPILKRLALEAPGSYHHSLLVATLAEKAAEALKLDPLLVKAGAMYHDIGKLRRPDYFVENRSRNTDAHRGLTPALSALVIINHVKDGAEMGKKLRLPRRIRDIIEQHHGNSLVRFFYQKAKEKYDPEMHDIGEEQFRYPGPAPRSKEAALIMLADAVEAASKTLRAPSEAHFKRLISAILDGFLEDGQLDDCDFSLKDIKTIASSFLETLDSLFHPRVDYPGYEFENKPPAAREARNGKNGKNGRGGSPDDHDRGPEHPDEIQGP
jgi:putative nucleotidyltransferase with HDIG domain